MNEEDLEELKRLAAAEKEERVAKKTEAHRRWKSRNPQHKEVNKLWRQAKPEEKKEHDRAKKRAWARANREHVYAYSNAFRVKKQEEIAARPKPEICEVCGNGGKIVFDHCHTSNKFRGWLCNPCNIALGMLEDDPERLEKLLVYLRQEET